MEIRNLLLGIIYFPDSIYSFDNIDKVDYGASEYSVKSVYS